MDKRLLIIGAGPAGLAAAKAAYDAGERDILILEREASAGGILNQCIHNGFGLHTFREELTGPEYAERYLREVKERGIEIMTDTTVVSISADRRVTCVNERDGLMRIQAGAIILACGCRERPRGAINIAGCRAAGIFSAGTAQKLINIDGFGVGKEVVILGSGDIGLIMARRMTFEGAKVKAVVELMPYSSGLNRNIVQCLNDFEIPLLFSHTVVEIRGDKRVSSVVIAQVDDRLQPIMETAREITCDTLLLSVGLLPENELAKMASVPLSPVTGGATVCDDMMTRQEGIFACGNVLHVHDLVDFVSEESEHAGKCAVAYLNGKAPAEKCVEITPCTGVRYVVPQRLNRDGGEESVKLKMRVGNVFKNKRLVVRADGEELYSRKRPVVTPGEMETVVLTPAQAAKARAAAELTVGLEGEDE